MENTKIQTLWNMCLELKDKRQSLLEQWRNTQHYLDSKQTLIENEFEILRQNNTELAQDVDSLYSQLAQFQHFWKSYFGDVVGLQQSFAHLGGSYQELNGSFSQLYSELAHLSEDIKAFTSRSDASSDELIGLRERFEAQQQKLQETYAQYQAQKDHLATLNQEKRLQQDSISSLQGELESLHGHFSDLGASLQSFHQELASYREKWQQEKTAHLQATEVLQAEHSELQQTHAELQTRHTELQSDHTRLHKEHADLNASHSTQTEHLQSVEAELATAQQTLVQAADLSQTALVELAELRKAVSEVDQEAVTGALADLKAQVAAALSQSADTASELAAELAALQSKQAETQAELATARTELASHKAELETAQTELETRSEALKAVQTELAERTEALASAQTELTESAEALKSAQSELEERAESLASAQSELESTQAQLAERVSAYETAQSELEASQAQLAERSTALTEAQAELATAQAELSSKQAAFENDQAELSAALKARAEEAEAAVANLAQRESQMAGFIQGFADLREAHAQLRHQIELLQAQQAPLEQESALLKSEQDELRQKLAEQENQLKVLNTQVHDSSEEVGRKEKLLAQLESYGEESDAIRSARTELVEELKAARTRLESLSHNQEQASQARSMLFQTLEQTSEGLEQKQQEFKQVEQELRYRQEHLEQLEAFLSGLERTPQGPLNLPDLDAPTVVVEVKEVNVADPAVLAQLQVAEAQIKALEAALEEKEAALEQALQQSAVDHLLDDFAAEAEALNEADLERQADIDLAISEEVEQISSLLSEINFGASQAFEGEGAPELSILDLDNPAPVMPAAPKPEVLKPDAKPAEVASAPAAKVAPVVVIYSRQVDRNADWDQQLRTYLEEYACSHHWLTGTQQPDFGAAIKGLVFLLEPSETINENLYQEAQRRNIPFIKHYISNITRLKIDILDAFIR